MSWLAVPCSDLIFIIFHVRMYFFILFISYLLFHRGNQTALKADCLSFPPSLSLCFRSTSPMTQAVSVCKSLLSSIGLSFTNAFLHGVPALSTLDVTAPLKFTLAPLLHFLGVGVVPSSTAHEVAPVGTHRGPVAFSPLGPQ